MSSKQGMLSLLPTETLELEGGLSLIPRTNLLLTIHRSDASVKPIDDWQLKRSLIDYLKASLSLSVPEDDLHIRSFKDLKKRKREDPVARGALFIYGLGFLSKADAGEVGGVDVEKKLFDWRKSVVDRMDGIQLNLVGMKFRLTVEVPPSDDANRMTKESEERYAFGGRGCSRGGERQPDTIILSGIPSRWVAEPRVSSKPSMLVAHTIFSALGKIRNLDVAEDDGIGKDADEENADIVSGLHCKIVVRFEDHGELCNALKVLCGRSLQKQGSRLRVNYEVTWDKDGLFKTARREAEETSGRFMPAAAADRYNREAIRNESHVSHLSTVHSHTKRFKG